MAGWILNEDNAVKKKLQGLRVVDANAPTAGRIVPVRFRLPETEFVDATFPMIIINRTNILRDEAREHRGKVNLMYTPESQGAWNPLVEDYNTSPYHVDFPVPYNIDYEITVYSRKEQHNVSLAVQLAADDRIPARFGYLEIPEDGTIRRLDLEGGPEFDTGKDSDGKRLFHVKYVIRVSTEMPPEIAARAALWTTTNIDLSTISETYS